MAHSFPSINVFELTEGQVFLLYDQYQRVQAEHICELRGAMQPLSIESIKNLAYLITGDEDKADSIAAHALLQQMRDDDTAIRQQRQRATDNSFRNY